VLCRTAGRALGEQQGFAWLTASAIQGPSVVVADPRVCPHHITPPTTTIQVDEDDEESEADDELDLIEAGPAGGESQATAQPPGGGGGSGGFVNGGKAKSVRMQVGALVVSAGWCGCQGHLLPCRSSPALLKSFLPCWLCTHTTPGAHLQARGARRGPASS
jgi:hypothetical protein